MRMSRLVHSARDLPSVETVLEARLSVDTPESFKRLKRLKHPDRVAEFQVED